MPTFIVKTWHQTIVSPSLSLITMSWKGVKSRWPHCDKGLYLSSGNYHVVSSDISSTQSKTHFLFWENKYYWQVKTGNTYFKMSLMIAKYKCSAPYFWVIWISHWIKMKHFFFFNSQPPPPWNGYTNKLNKSYPAHFRGKSFRHQRSAYVHEFICSLAPPLPSYSEDQGLHQLTQFFFSTQTLTCVLCCHLAFEEDFARVVTFYANKQIATLSK